jgi:Fe2+ or Zn2+ uptake regulation protein
VTRTGQALAGPAAGTRRRSTRQLDATFRVLFESREHPTAEQVYHAVRRQLPSVSRGTVYRNLGKLVASERVRLVHVHDRCARYDARLEPHDHFFCSRCTMLLDVEIRATARPRRPSRVRIRGHRIEGRTLTYFGLCRGCEQQGGTKGDT